MRSAMKLVCLGLAIGLGASPAMAADGVVIHQRTTSGGTARDTQVQIVPQKMRAEVNGPGGTPQVVIFDGAKQVMWLVDNGKKSYTEMTKADVDRLGGQLGDMMAKMQEQLKNLPPAQRAQIEAAMQGRGFGAAPARPEYKPTGSDRVGKWSCAKYDGFENGQKTSEVCTVDPGELGLSAADMAVARQLGEFFRGIVPQGRAALIAAPEDVGLKGVPVRTTHVGPRPSVDEIVDVRRETIADALFVVPDGYTKTTLPNVPGAQ